MPLGTGTLILVCGLPGAGKTTFAKAMARERMAIRMCPDEWIEQILADDGDAAERDRLRDPVENLQWDLAREYLGSGFTVILENGFWAEEERSLYAMGALELGSRIELFFLEADLDLLWNRVQARNAVLERKTWIMSREEVEAAWRQFQPPQSEELDFYDESAVIQQV